jgi:hypothetical protein
MSKTFENGMRLNLRSATRIALLNEANEQGISMAALAAKILTEYLINPDIGEHNENKEQQVRF